MTDINHLHLADALARFYTSPEAFDGLSGQAFDAHKSVVLTALDKGLSLTCDYQSEKAPMNRFLKKGTKRCSSASCFRRNPAFYRGFVLAN